MQKNRLPGVLLILIAVLAWGGQAPVSKLALDHVDAYFLALARCVLALPVFVALLALARGDWRVLL